jgi:uncharacterized protein (TIGR03437 family)
MKIFVAFAMVCVAGYGQAVITTVAGNGTLSYSGDGGPATSAALGLPSDVAIDGSGNLYIVDRNNSRIRKVTPGGTISTFAGVGRLGFSGDGGPAVNAFLFQPTSIAVSAAGDVYIADTGNSRIRKVSPAGVITTVAGGDFHSGDGIPATTTSISADSVALDAAGNIYTSDNNNRIRKIDNKGLITTLTASVLGYSGDGGPAKNAAVNLPSGIVVDPAGNLYFADRGNFRIRKIDTNGIITTVAGNGIAGFSGDGGPAINAQIGRSGTAYVGLTLDTAGNLYFADPANNRIRMVNTAGMITTYAGSGTLGTGTQGDGGPPTLASLAQPNSIFADASGAFYIADTNHDKIRKITGGAGRGIGGSSGPTISSAGVVNGASFEAGVVANSWVTILGSNFATKNSDWSNSVVNGQLPTSLDGVSVTIGGQNAYVYFVSPNQINVLAPNVSPGQVGVIVTTPTAASTSVNTTASVYGPAFFTWPGGQPVATRQDYSFAVRNGTFSGATTVPAKPGEVIILWGTGFGPTTPAAPTGMATGSGTVYSTATLPTVTLNGAQLQVYGAALTPGSAGLYQVAVQLPQIADGSYVLRASIGGAQSPANVTLSVCSTTACGTGGGGSK